MSEEPSGLAKLIGEGILAYRLTIEGLPVRVYAMPEGVDPEPADVPGTGGALEYLDLYTLGDISGWTDRFDSVGGLGEAGSLGIVILTDELDGELDDIGEWVTAVPSVVTRVALLTETVDGDATTWKVDRDVSGETLPALWHCGQEAVWVTAAAGSDPDPADADPYRVTVTRAAAGSRAVQHVAQPLSSAFPGIYRLPVSWKRRRAVLSVCYCIGTPGRDLQLDGQWLELRRGFIEDFPELTPDGLAFELDLLPLTALFDKAAEARATVTGLAQGYHQFDGIAASGIEWAIYQRGGIDMGSTRDPSVANGGELNVAVEDHAALFDVSLPSSHPRSGPIRMRNRVAQGLTYRVESYADPGGGAPDEALVLAPRTGTAMPEQDIGANEPVMTAPATELRRVEIPAGVHEWPWDIYDLWRDAATNSRLGLDGALVDVTPQPGHGGFDNVGLSALNNTMLGGDERPVAILWDPHQAKTGGYRQPGFLIEWRPDRITTPEPSRWHAPDAVRVLPRLNLGRQLHYPLFHRTAEDGKQGTWHRADPSNLPMGTSIYSGILATAPSAFYQIGEPVVLLAADIGDPADADDGEFALAIEWSEPWVTNTAEGALRQRQTVDVIARTEVVLPNGESAWAYTLKDPRNCRSFGDWPGLDPSTVRRTLRRLPGGDALVELLEQDLRLTEDDYDYDSMVRFGDPLGLAFSPPTLVEPTELRDIIHPIGVSTGTGFMMRTDNSGRNRLTRVMVGPESPLEMIEAYSDDDFDDQNPPTYGVDRTIIGVVQIEADFGPDGEPRQTTPPIKYQPAIELAGDDPDVLDIALYGVRAETMLDLYEIAYRVFAIGGAPRRTYKVSLPLGLAWPLFAGAVVRLTSAHVRGLSGMGINGLYARITEINFRLDQARVDFLAHHTGINATGWNASLLVTGQVDADTVTVSSSADVPPVHPVTGADISALDLWAVGDACVIRPKSDHDNAVTTTITAIDRETSRVTFADAHALSGPGWGAVEPAGYDAASETHRQLGYLADADGNLGGDDDAGYQAV